MKETHHFVTLLRACAKNKDLCKGTRLHEDILRLGLLEHCSDALVTMYAKCGDLVKAKELFDMHRTTDVLTWTALVAGYVQNGQGQEAIDCFHYMQHEGVSPDAVTYSCALKACGIIKALGRGKKIHDEIAKHGLLGNNFVLGTALLDMYAKCGALAQAQQVLWELPVRNVVTWTALMAGYIEHGKGEQALNCLEQMHNDGLSPNTVTYACALKSCGDIGAIDKGEIIHDEIAKQGLLASDSTLGNELVVMYAKCGALIKAQGVLEELPVRNVISWNALIAGYAEQGVVDQALNCLKQMQQDGLSPDTVTFISILKVCGSIREVDKGQELHNQITKQGLLGNNLVLGNALVNMYAKCGALAKAQQMLEELPVRDIVSWNALIAGCAEHGEGEQALSLFLQMQEEGHSPDAMTYTSVLKGCGTIRAVDKGRKVHDEIRKQGLLENNVFLGNALVDMYAKCGSLSKAREVLAELPDRNKISWTLLIEGYAEHGDGEQAIESFDQMLSEGLSPDAVTFICILKACGSIGDAVRGAKLHDEILKQGLLENNTALGNALVDMYAKCGDLIKARRVLEELPVRDVISWNTVITACVDHEEGEEALNCYEQMQGEGLCPNVVTYICILKACSCTQSVDKGIKIHDEIAKKGLLGKSIMLSNSLIDMYVKCGAIAKARQTLVELHCRDVYSWNALIVGCAERGEGEEALSCFERMQSEGISPDAVTYTYILKVCGSLGATDKGEKVHDELGKQGLLGYDIVLDNALVDMYAKCGVLKKAQEVLEGLPKRDATTWNALISGYGKHAKYDEALNCFGDMQREGLSAMAETYGYLLRACGSIRAADEGDRICDAITKEGLLCNDLVLGTALVDMYAKCGALKKAQGVMEELPFRNVICWTSLIAGYVEHGEAEEAVNCFERMRGEGLSPDAVTFICLLNACGSIGAANKGGEIHDEIAKQELVQRDFVVGNALVTMYAKCGALAKAQQVLEQLPLRDVTSWNALIAGCAEHGEGIQALNFFKLMQDDGISPNMTTFSCILNACSRVGLLEDAERHFVTMTTEFGMKPTLEQYTSMMDLFGRAGHLDKAVRMIEKMSTSDAAVWSALMGACWKWADVELGRWVCERAVQANKMDTGVYSYGKHLCSYWHEKRC